MKKKLSRVAALFLAAVMIVAGLTVAPPKTVNAAGAPTFSIRMNVTQMKPGDEVHAEFWMETGEDLINITGGINFNPEQYQYVEDSVVKNDDDIRGTNMFIVDDQDAYTAGGFSVLLDMSKPLKAPVKIFEFDVIVADDATGNANMSFGCQGCETGTDKNRVEVPVEEVEIVTKDAGGNVIEGGDVPVYIKLESIEIDKLPFTMAKGTTEKLNVIGTPEAGLIGKTVTWTSTNDNVIKVDQAGNIEAVGIGKATVTAEAGGKSDSVEITVNAPLTGIELNKSEITLKKGTTETLIATLKPSDTTDDKTITWTSDDESVATVNAAGEVTAIKDGKATITASAGNGKFTARCTVNVKEVNLESISLDKKTLTLNKGESSDALTVTYNPTDTTDDKTVEWTSNDEKVATVEDGVVTAVGAGSTTITAKVGDHTAICDVTVIVKLNAMEIAPKEAVDKVEAGDVIEMEVAYDPEDASNKDVTWSSDNEAIATVDENGVVTAVAGGDATITATSVENTEIKAEYKLHVQKHTTKITLSDTELELQKGTEKKLTVAFDPDDTDDSKAVTWESDNEAVATVDENGVVTAVAGGKATITVTSDVNKNHTASCEVNVVSKLTSITITPDKATMEKDETVNIAVTYNPADTTDTKDIEWTSSDDNIATVTADGEGKAVVTAVGGGTATITATSKADASITATCDIKVLIHTESIELDQKEMELQKNESSAPLKVTFNPEGTDDSKEVTWTSSNDKVATVKDGVVTAVGVGTATITATTKADESITATCEVNVVSKLTSIKITPDKATDKLEVNDEVKMTVTYNPEDTTDSKELTWTSSDEKVATVTADGEGKAVVTAVGGGTATITATSAADKNITAKCDIKVLIHTESIKLNQEEMELLKGETSEALKVTFNPTNTDDSKEVEWSSSDKDVAPVDAEGKVTGLKAGTATITAKTADGKHTASCEVTVKEIHVEDAEISAELNPDELYKGQTHQLKVTINPENTTDEVKYTYTSSDEEVAVVSPTGKVRAIKAGTAEITILVTAGDFEKELVYKVEVKEIPLESIAFKEKVTPLEEGKTAQLAILFNPSDTTDDKTVEWSSSDTAVATISANGLVKAVKEGKTTITAKVGEKEISYELTVTKKKEGTSTGGKDDPKNNGGAVKTGDSMNLFGMILAMLISLSAAASVVVFRRRMHK